MILEDFIDRKHGSPRSDKTDLTRHNEISSTYGIRAL